MRKEYNKPDIVFESFTLSSNIAGSCDPYYSGLVHADSCDATVNSSDAHSCQFNDVVPLFIQPNSCEYGPQDENEYNTCYHNPGDYLKYFSS